MTMKQNVQLKKEIRDYYKKISCVVCGSKIQSCM